MPAGAETNETDAVSVHHVVQNSPDDSDGAAQVLEPIRWKERRLAVHLESTPSIRERRPVLHLHTDHAIVCGPFGGALPRPETRCVAATAAAEEGCVPRVRGEVGGVVDGQGRVGVVTGVVAERDRV